MCFGYKPDIAIKVVQSNKFNKELSDSSRFVHFLVVINVSQHFINIYVPTFSTLKSSTLLVVVSIGTSKVR